MAKSAKKQTVQITNNVDTNTGEIQSSECKTISFEREPDYIKMYLDDLGKLSNLSGTQNNFLRILLRKMNYDNEIFIHTEMRTFIMTQLNVSKSTLAKAIEAFVDGGILLKKSNNLYLFNPNLFAKGSWRDIKELRMTISYNAQGRLIKTDFSKNPLATQTELNMD